MLQLIISLIPFLVILFVLWFKYGKNKNLLNIIFWGFISMIVTLILNIPLQNVFNSNLFLEYLVTAGIIEELMRLYSTKLSKPQNKNELIYNIFMISAVFTSLEDYCYYDGEVETLFYRCFSPMHLFFALIMIILLCKAYDNRNTNKNKSNVYKVLAFIVPAIIHGYWDYSLVSVNNYSNFYNILILASVLGYLLPIIYILVKVKPNENNEVIMVSIWKKIIVIVFGLMVLIGFHV